MARLRATSENLRLLERIDMDPPEGYYQERYKTIRVYMYWHRCHKEVVYGWRGTDYSGHHGDIEKIAKPQLDQWLDWIALYQQRALIEKGASTVTGSVWCAPAGKYRYSDAIPVK